MNKSTNKIVFFTLGLVVLCSVLFILNHFQTSRTIDSSLDLADNSVSARRYLIEKEYPGFRDFEKQKSFAGQSVKLEIIDFDYYFAYLVHGSGLPIAQATCFRVDRVGRVFQTGLFPDPLDSYVGYASVNPVNCKGIK